MKVLFVSAEVAPMAKVGGLADVAGSLPKALQALAHEVVTVMPAYPMILQDPTYETRELHPSFEVPIRPGHTVRATLYELVVGNVTHWLIEVPGFESCLSPDSIYSPGRDAYLTFSCAVLHACKALGWAPDVVHCHDWHTAFIPVLIRERFATEMSATASTFTIHNLAYQGEFGKDTLAAVGLPDTLFTFERLETFGSVNFLKAGCIYADQVNTVSPNYAREIQTPEYGCGLWGLMRHLAAQHRLRGILNGIDTEFFNPSIDPEIAHPFNAADPTGKQACKVALQTRLGLAVEPASPLIGMVSRLSEQKGFDLVLSAMGEIFDRGCQLVIQAIGDASLAEHFRRLQVQQPKQFRYIDAFDPSLAQQVYAGSDMFLMPSSFEPCGLGQMIALRYGTIPIVRKTGGLADTIHETVNGFTFESRSVSEMVGAIDRAVLAYKRPGTWKELVKTALSEDWGWQRSASEYVQFYADAMHLRRAGTADLTVSSCA